jgi:hypothetical protein
VQTYAGIVIKGKLSQTSTLRQDFEVICFKMCQNRTKTRFIQLCRKYISNGIKRNNPKSILGEFTMIRLAIKGILIWMMLWAGAALATTHALILSIGEYQTGVTPLTGVKYDMESARKIAHSLGVTDENILQFHDSELTLAGMRKAFEKFIKRVGATTKYLSIIRGTVGDLTSKIPRSVAPNHW